MKKKKKDSVNHELEPARYYTTEQAREKLGLTKAALYNYIHFGVVNRPQHFAGMSMLWTDAEIERARTQTTQHLNSQSKSKSKTKKSNHA